MRVIAIFFEPRGDRGPAAFAQLAQEVAFVSSVGRNEDDRFDEDDTDHHRECDFPAKAALEDAPEVRLARTGARPVLPKLPLRPARVRDRSAVHPTTDKIPDFFWVHYHGPGLTNRKCNEQGAPLRSQGSENRPPWAFAGNRFLVNGDETSP